jgi:hypothetical protein
VTIDQLLPAAIPESPSSSSSVATFWPSTTALHAVRDAVPDGSRPTPEP